MASTNTLPQPDPAPQSPQKIARPRRSSIPANVKAQVIACRYVDKMSITSIAKELQLSRPTIYVILEEANLDRQFEAGRLTCSTLIPQAITAIDSQLKKGDGELGRKFLNDMGVIGHLAQRKTAPEALHLSQAINIMFKAQGVAEQPAIEVKSAEAIIAADR